MLNKKEYKNAKIKCKYDAAEELRKLRLMRELNINEVSEKAGFAPTVLRHIEMGNFKDLEGVFYLARFYDKRIKIEFY